MKRAHVTTQKCLRDTSLSIPLPPPPLSHPALDGPLPRLAHLITGSKDDSSRLVASDWVMRRFGNVFVVGRADLLTLRGPTMVASVLRAVSVLLRRAVGWDWFVNLSADDYPLVSQDDLFHVFSYLPRHLNFVEHTSNLG